VETVVPEDQEIPEVLAELALRALPDQPGSEELLVGLETREHLAQQATRERQAPLGLEQMLEHLETPEAQAPQVPQGHRALRGRRRPFFP
jgi:hypothetical protein